MDTYGISRPTIENRLIKTSVLLEEKEKYQQ
jgi:hypothetical protein